MFSKDADEAANLFQEVPVNLWRGMGGFGGRSDVRTWIYRVSLKKYLREPRPQAAPGHGIARLCLPMRPQNSHVSALTWRFFAENQHCMGKIH